MFQDMSKKLNESAGPVKELVEVQTRMLEKITRLQMECAQSCARATLMQTRELPSCRSTEELIALQREYARLMEESLLRASENSLETLKEARERMEQIAHSAFDAFAPRS